MFWNILYKLCEKNSTKPYIVAKEIGVSNSVCTKWKNGSIPNGETLLKLSNYFGVSIDYLLGNTPNSSPTVTQTITGNDNNYNIASGTDSSVNSDIPKRDLELMEKINSLDFEDYAEIINAVNQKLKKKNSA